MGAHMIETQPTELTLAECERVIRWGSQWAKRAKTERGRRALFSTALLAFTLIYCLLLPAASALLMACHSLWWSILAMPAVMLAILITPWCVRSFREMAGITVANSARWFQQKQKENVPKGYRVDDSRISITHETRRSDFTWSDVDFYDVQDDLTLISMKPEGNLMVIPQRAFASDADAQAMVALLRAKAKLCDLELWVDVQTEHKKRKSS